PPTEVKVTVPDPQVHVEAPIVNVAAAEIPAAIINVAASESPAPIVNISQAEQPAPIVNIAPPDMSGVAQAIKELGAQLKADRAPKKRWIERDPDGRIIGL